MCTVNPYLISFLNIDDTHNVPERSRTRAFHFLDELRVQVRQQVLPEELWRQLNELLHDTREEHDAKTAYALSHRHTHTLSASHTHTTKRRDHCTTTTTTTTTPNTSVILSHTALSTTSCSTRRECERSASTRSSFLTLTLGIREP